MKNLLLASFIFMSGCVSYGRHKYTQGQLDERRWMTKREQECRETGARNWELEVENKRLRELLEKIQKENDEKK